MQLIELAGCAEDFTRDRGDPGTTLGRFDDALRPVFEVRTPHTHPEIRLTLPPLTPRRLSVMIEQLKTAIGNLDADTLRIQPRSEMQALNGIAVGLARIEKDGLPDPTALRPRDLHYAGYYREIQFGRLAKATGLYDNWGKSQDARHVDINRSIFDADNMAHKFHVMRGGPDKSILPESVVAPERSDRVAGRSLSELMRELRDEYQTPAERLAELEIPETRRARGEYRTAVEELADGYARITSDPKAALLVREYLRQREPRLKREEINAMREALFVAAAPEGNYRAVPDVVQRLCIDAWLGKYDNDPDAFGSISRTTLPVKERLTGLLEHDRRKLDDARIPRSRAVGTCRDFALVLCAFLRTTGTAARVRCGFASHFGDSWEDHWVCEYWSDREGRWCLSDAQLDEVIQAACGIEFDTSNLPRDVFLTAGEAWLRCRDGKDDPKRFGQGNIKGLWFMKVNVVRDAFAVNNRETSAWDRWREAPPELRTVSPSEVATLDRLARHPEDGVEWTPPWLADVA